MKINPNYTLFTLDIKTPNLDINLVKEYLCLNLINNDDLYSIINNEQINFEDHIDFYRSIICTLIKDPKYAFELIKNRILNTYDSPFFEQALDACSKNNKYVFELIDKKIIKNSDYSNFWKNGIKKIYLKSPKKAYSALYKNIINKYGSYNIYVKLIEKCLKDPYYGLELLTHNIIEKESSYYFDLIEKCLKSIPYSYALIEKKVILGEGKDIIFFKKAIENCSQNTHYGLKLIENKLLKIDSNHWITIMESLMQHPKCCEKLITERLIPHNHKYWSKAYAQL